MAQVKWVSCWSVGACMRLIPTLTSNRESSWGRSASLMLDKDSVSRRQRCSRGWSCRASVVWKRHGQCLLPFWSGAEGRGFAPAHLKTGGDNQLDGIIIDQGEYVAAIPHVIRGDNKVPKPIFDVQLCKEKGALGW